MIANGSNGTWKRRTWLAAVAVVAAAGALALRPPNSEAQACQGQTCADNGSCFYCLGSVGHGCSETNCNSCTTTRCVQLPELASRGVSSAALEAICSQAAVIQRVPGAVQAAPVSFRQGSPNGKGQISLQFGLIAQTYPAPAELFQVEQVRPDDFAGGVLVNGSDNAIKSYTLAAVIVDNGHVSFQRGTPVVQSIAAKGIVHVPPQLMRSPTLVGPRDAGMYFFVADVELADGTLWKANQNAVARQAKASLASGQN